MATRKRRVRRRKAHRQLGAPPGTLTAPPDASATTVRTIAYGPKKLVDEEGLRARASEPVRWVDVQGLADVARIVSIGEELEVHPLALEDVLAPHQRPKVEEYPAGLFIVTRVVRSVADASAPGGVGVDVEQIAMFVGEGFVATFQEREGDSFEPVRERIRASRGRIRTQGAAYLAYALLDAAVDGMFPVLEAFEERLQELEEEIFDDPTPALSEDIHDLKGEVMRVRRAVLPMREALQRLMRDPHPLIDDDLRMYLRDCHDHLAQMVDLLEAQRELATSLKEAHLTSLGHRSNEVMKVLTMIATIFIPLSFIAGLYGMNFDTSSPMNMPELSLRWGYPAVVGLMVSIGVAMLVYFRRKRWL